MANREVFVYLNNFAKYRETFSLKKVPSYTEELYSISNEKIISLVSS
jgi:hypothetical protein